MTKKVLLGLFILLIGAIGFVSYNFYKKTKLPAINDPVIAIPKNAAIIIQEQDFKAVYKKLSSTNIIWEELTQNTNLAQELDLKIAYLDSLLQLTNLENIWRKSALTSMHLSGANDYNFIFYVPIPSSISENELIKKIKEITSQNIENRTYNEATIFSLTDNKNKKISFVYKKNILSLSYNNVLIESVIDQFNANESLLDDSHFLKAYQTSGEAMDGNILINNIHFSKILSQYLNLSSKETLKQFEHYSDWTALDVSIKSNSMMMNGFSHSSDSSHHFLTLLKNQEPQNISITNIIPSNTALLYYYGLSNSTQFFNDREVFLSHHNLTNDYQSFINEQVDSFSLDLKEEFLSIVGNELAFAITEPSKNDYTDNCFVIFQTNATQKAKDDLIKLGSKLNRSDYSPTEFKGYNIHQLDLNPSVFRNLFGEPFPIFKHLFYTLINDYVVFGNNVSAIKTIINQYSFGRTLSKNSNFEAFKENLASKSNIFIYNNIARSVNLYKTFASEPFAQVIEEKTALYQKFEAIAFQVNSDKNDLYYNNIYLKYNPVYKQDTRTLWETTLDTTSSTKPRIVTNHNTNAKEIFVQDDNNKIYLISNTGKILWSKQLEEPIISEIHQIDVFKNNKFQLLFNTKTKLYLLDRNGNNVTSFPVKLKAEATNGVTPLDYVNNKNYRILIGCADNTVYNYNVDGNLVNGWEYTSTQNTANSKIWHLTLSEKDYIIIPLQDGSVKIIQRNGKDRIKLTNKLPITNHPIFLIKGNQLKSTYLLTADSNGTITKLYFDNKLETINTETDINQKFHLFDLNNDRISDFIFTDSTNLKVISEDKTSLFEITFEQTINCSSLSFIMPNKSRKIGVVASNKIFLIDEKGMIEEDFPLTGSTPFSISDINNDKILNLIVADKNMIYTYNLR